MQFLQHKSWAPLDAIGQSCQGIWWDLVWQPLVMQSQLRKCPGIVVRSCYDLCTPNLQQKSLKVRRKRNRLNSLKYLQVVMTSKVIRRHLVQQCGRGTFCSFARTCEKALAAAQGASNNQAQRSDVNKCYSYPHPKNNIFDGLNSTQTSPARFDILCIGNMFWMNLDDT